MPEVSLEAFHDKSGTYEFAAPKGWGPCMVFTDWSAAPAKRPLYTLAQMFRPPARAIGHGDRTNAAGLQDTRELAKNHRRILYVLDDLVRGDVIEDRICKRQSFQHRLVEPGLSRIGSRHRPGQRHRRDIDAMDPEPGRQPLQICRLDPVPQPASS